MMTNDTTFETKYKEVLVETCDVFVKFLESKGLRYFCAGGTAIGAARHQDIIPWDDDIDLFMPREDYEKLKEYRDDVPSNFSLICPDNDNSPFVYVKFVNDNTTFWEMKQLPYLSGIFIDVFPLDQSNQNVDEFVKTFKKLHRIRQILLLTSYKFSVEMLRWKNDKEGKKLFYMNILSLLFPKFLRPVIRNWFLKIENKIKSCKNGKAICSYLGSYYEKEYMQNEWFKDSIVMPFSNIKLRMPKGYDNYLSHAFGNYMQLPPVEKRVAEHQHFYVNLSKRLTKEEVLERVKLGYTSEL